MSETKYIVDIDATTVLIYVMRTAGVCGPAQETERPDHLDSVDAWLELQGFRRAGGYDLVQAYDGLRLSAELIEI